MADTDTTALLKRVERLEAIEDIVNLMGRRAYLLGAGLGERELDECWAVEHDDLEFAPVHVGTWAGREDVRSVVLGLGMPGDTADGTMFEHTLTTRFLEFGDDGQTARGLWISPGHETFQRPGDDRPRASWYWCRYDIDFVKESVGWRILHLRLYQTFNAAYDQDWVEAALNPPATEGFDSAEPPPWFPPLSRRDRYDAEYSLDRRNLQQPLPS